jgi:hypothetical protein
VAGGHQPPEFGDALRLTDVLRRNPLSKSARENIGHQRLEKRVRSYVLKDLKAQVHGDSKILFLSSGFQSSTIDSFVFKG